MAADKSLPKAPAALKALVIGLGLVIVGLLGAVIWGIARQADRLERVPEMTDVEVAVPLGCELAEAVPDGRLLVLRLSGPAERGCQQAVIVDPAAGAVVGRVRLAPQRPGIGLR